LNFAKSDIVGKSYIGEETSLGFLNFCVASSVLILTLSMRYFNKIFPKCLSLGETRWALGTAALLVSYWLKAFSCGFFLFGQQMKTSGDTVGNGPSSWAFLKMSPLCPQGFQYW
jgi:hypothetical protein